MPVKTLPVTSKSTLTLQAREVKKLPDDDLLALCDADFVGDIDWGLPGDSNIRRGLVVCVCAQGELLRRFWRR